MSPANVKKIQTNLTCDIQRKQQAIEALLGLAWKKRKKERPQWIEEDIKSYLKQSKIS